MLCAWCVRSAPMSDRIGILIDTKGPEIRTREIEKPILLETGETVRIVRSVPSGKAFCVSYPQFIDEVPKGAVILIEDGTIELEAVQKNQDELVCITTWALVLNSQSRLPDSNRGHRGSRTVTSYGKPIYSRALYRARVKAGHCAINVGVNLY